MNSFKPQFWQLRWNRQIPWKIKLTETTARWNQIWLARCLLKKSDYPKALIGFQWWILWNLEGINNPLLYKLRWRQEHFRTCILRPPLPWFQNLTKTLVKKENTEGESQETLVPASPSHFVYLLFHFMSNTRRQESWWAKKSNVSF